MTNTTPKEDAVEANTVDSTQVPASLTIQDLINIRSIIDVASQRGAFKTNEFTAIGEIYTKLANFITAIEPAPDSGSGPAPDSGPAPSAAPGSVPDAARGR